LLFVLNGWEENRNKSVFSVQICKVVAEKRRNFGLADFERYYFFFLSRADRNRVFFFFSFWLLLLLCDYRLAYKIQEIYNESAYPIFGGAGEQQQHSYIGLHTGETKSKFQGEKKLIRYFF
jgi:hypothetical protein